MWYLFLLVKNISFHEMQAVYYNYQGDLSRALEHFLDCANWQKAHSIFMTSVAHILFLSGKLFVCTYIYTSRYIALKMLNLNNSTYIFMLFMMCCSVFLRRNKL